MSRFGDGTRTQELLDMVEFVRKERYGQYKEDKAGLICDLAALIAYYAERIDEDD